MCLQDDLWTNSKAAMDVQQMFQQIGLAPLSFNGANPQLLCVKSALRTCKWGEIPYLPALDAECYWF